MSDFEGACQLLLEWRKQGIDTDGLARKTLVCEHGKKMALVLPIDGVDVLSYRPPIWVNPNDDLAPWPKPEDAEPQTWPADGYRIRRRGPERLLNPHANSELIEVPMTSHCCGATTTLGWIRKRLAEPGPRAVVGAEGL